MLLVVVVVVVVVVDAAAAAAVVVVGLISCPEARLRRAKTGVFDRRTPGSIVQRIGSSS